MTILRSSTRNSGWISPLIFSAWLGCATPQAAPAPTMVPAPQPIPTPIATEPSLAALPLDRWSEIFPEANKALLAWATHFPHASKRVSTWDEEHAEETKELVIWALAYPDKSFAAFADTHAEWPDVVEFTTKQKPGIEAFLNWCQKYEDAVRALLDHPGGLARVMRLGMDSAHSQK